MGVSLFSGKHSARWWRRKGLPMEESKDQEKQELEGKGFSHCRNCNHTELGYFDGECPECHSDEGFIYYDPKYID